MKKLFITLVVALMCATMSFAQNTLVATLSHGEDITMYYGAYALRDAFNAAASGDVINLSGGAFQAIDITKGITLRGTGIDAAAPTYISGDFIINVATDDPNRLSMEGVRCNGTIAMDGSFNNPYFMKSQFNSFYYRNSPTIKNAIFGNCKITGSYTMEGTSTVQFINSFVKNFQNGGNSTANLINSVISTYHNGGDCYINNSTLLNCIIFKEDSYYYSTVSLSRSSVAFNCVAIHYDNYFNGNSANSNCKTSSFAELFKTFTGTYSDAETFELTDEAKTQFLGSDGTEIGMFGGVLPYTSTPSYPHITKMNVANKTTADGKLSVEIEVSAVE